MTAFAIGLATESLHASNPLLNVQYTSIAGAPNGGFWVQVDAGNQSRTIAVAGATLVGNVPFRGSIIPTQTNAQEGFLVIAPNGLIYAGGSSKLLCSGVLSSCSNFPKNPNDQQMITAAAITPDSLGFWAVGYDGRLWTAGTANPYGDTVGSRQPPTGIAATPSGRGYYIVEVDGGVYSFGDAVFYGSTGGRKPGGHNVTGMALSHTANGDVNGYWLVADDGGVSTYGNAQFLGSSGGNNGGSQVTGIATRGDQRGYAWVHADGRIEQSQTFRRATITSPNLGTVWTVPDGSTESGTPIQLLGVDGGADQQWDLWPTTSDGSVVQLVNVNSGLCADVTQQGKAPFKFSVIQYPCKGKTEGWDNQRFLLSTDSAGYTGFAPLNNPGYRVSADSTGAGLTLVAFGGVLSPSASWILNDVQ